MKKMFLMLLGAVLSCAGQAQLVEEGEAAMVYYSPKTSVYLDFTYTVETREKGVYSEFAEPLLGIDNAVTENGTTCVLNGVHIGTTTVTDYSRPHKVSAEPGVPLLLTINEKGLLKGYNLPLECAESGKNQHKAPAKSGSHTAPTAALSIAPYSEEVLEAATPLAQANAIAKQIFHIRDTRLYLLSGEVEHAPADGKSMQLVLDELARQEQVLTELFIGKTSSRTEHKHVVLAPSKEELLFFSDENGFTEPENIDADTIRIKMDLHPQVFKEVNEEKKKKNSNVSQIVYNLPGSGDIEVLYDGRSMAKRTIPIAQLGVDVPLDKAVFKGKELPVIVFSEKTGNIVSISK